MEAKLASGQEMKARDVDNFPIVFQHTSHVGMWICCEFTPFVGLSFSGVRLHERTDPEILGVTFASQTL